MRRSVGEIADTGYSVFSIKAESKRQDFVHKKDRDVLVMCTAAALCILYFVAILAPIVAIAGYSGFRGIAAAIADKGVMSAVGISLKTSTAALLLTFILGTPAAFFIKRRRANPMSRILEVLSGLPVVLPPAVAGTALLLVFGRNGIIGAALEKINVGIIFTPYAVVLAQFFVSSGFYIQMLGVGIGSIGDEIYEVSYILGAGKAETFFRIILPMVKKPLAAGLILSWTRSMGEFGATLMFAGNLEGVTRTLPLEIYSLMQSDINAAAAVSMILVTISLAALFILKIRFSE